MSAIPQEIIRPKASLGMLKKKTLGMLKKDPCGQQVGLSLSPNQVKMIGPIKLQNGGSKINNYKR